MEQQQQLTETWDLNLTTVNTTSNTVISKSVEIWDDSSSTIEETFGENTIFYIEVNNSKN